MATDRHRGWHYRGYMPHRDEPHLTQFITYRLADALPTEVVERLVIEERSRADRRRRLEELLEGGHGSSLLRRPEIAELVVGNWRHFAGVKYDLYGWVVMPNHVHLVVGTRQGWAMASIVHSWKSYTAKQIARRVESGTAKIWAREYWDSYIRSERQFWSTLDYVHMNPVVAGLVGNAVDWPWSSAREWVEGRAPGTKAWEF